MEGVGHGQMVAAPSKIWLLLRLQV